MLRFGAIQYGEQSPIHKNRQELADTRKMNTLGLAAYGSSSDEEEDEHIVHIAQTTKTALHVAPVAATAQRTEDDESEAMLVRAGIPPLPSDAQVDQETQERIRKYIAMQQERAGGDAAATGANFQESLREKKDVKNPYILEKVVEYFGIDELQSNFDVQVFDPYGMALHEYSDAIAVAQKKQIDERVQRQQQLMAQGQRHLQFVSSTTH